MTYTAASVPDQHEKTVFITGANTGIGYETARVLARKGARVLLGCRSEDRAAAAIKKIQQESPRADTKWIPLDLASLASVSEAAAMVDEEARLDVLINNAGVAVPPKTLTTDGFELQFGVNHLGHFALTGQLFDKLRSNFKARVVNVSSLAHRNGVIDFDDLAADKTYSPLARYRASKLANMYFTFEMADRCAEQGVDITCVACHPGIASTEISRYLPKWMGLLVLLTSPLLNTSAEGALPTLMAATREVKPKDYFGPVARNETARSADYAKVADCAHDKAIAKRLWVVSSELTGVEF